MAEFIGTKNEFHRYIGPILRNLVQQVTRKYRTEIGTCEHCGKKENLEAAHIHGKERKIIIEKLLNDYYADNIYKVDLQEFENKFRNEHEIIERTIIILCKDCHTIYDSRQDINKTEKFPRINTQKVPVNNRIYSNAEIQIKISDTLKKFNEFELDKFCHKEYSKEIFNLNFSLLVKLGKDWPLEKKKEVIKVNGINRWTLKYSIERNNSIYVISTQWYQRNDEFVKRWLNKNEK